MKFFCPLPQRFAVIQMDPVGMVKHYDDPIALAAAQAMKPKKYLVYLRTAQDMSTPQKPWFRYEVSPIATTLRFEEPEEGITSDMVIPIYPNTAHPAGRPPISPESPFPFPNCYFWIMNNLTVRIRRKAIRYDDSCAPILSVPESMTIESRFMPDYRRINAFLREKRGPAGNVDGYGDDSGQSDPPSPPLGYVAEDRAPSETDRHRIVNDDADSLLEGSDLHEDSDPDDIPTTPGDDDPPIRGDLALIMEMDIFGHNVDHTAEFLPLVDLWFEVADHLTAETIPSPVELYKERDMIMQ
ncbi:uncharacterized protein TRAVEDRAFT_132446 [Trametes versicolor FP-101664 SS1]|uniref:uncharacterized protein n=1 Tax=Trametes versicolor (strain FP-101664) TaxID=717944 RepID=UPI0004621A34|nr:uncharacterized protein TRAVEDRAFT_132446 [Trametes versicolor FP-101664 SS1]EIW54300.1 hypothetical protein TRAVEDRAFT_132446 [Trametes versicolor FP-101664 SS1]